ncbi:MAG: multidrug efflux SMR transporter [Umezawaea sp.]
MLKWTLLGVAILFEVFATMCMKFSDGFTRLLPALGVVVGYGISFYLDAQVVKLGLPIPVVYAVWSGGGIALVALANRWLTGEGLAWPTVVGLVVISSGVALVSFTTSAEIA